MYNLFNTCYLCLTGTQKLIPMYSKNGEDSKKIKYVLPELVIFGPEVPQFVCCSCLVTVTSFYLFKIKCMDTNHRLMNVVNKRRQLEQLPQQQRQLEPQQQQQRYLEPQLQQQQQQHSQRQLEHQQQQQQRNLEPQFQQQQQQINQQNHPQQHLEQQQQQQQLQLVQQQQQQLLQKQQQQLNQRQLEQQQQQIQRQLEQQRQQQRQLEQQQPQQQQINKAQPLQSPQQRQHGTTKSGLNYRNPDRNYNNAGTNLLSYNEARVQNIPVINVNNINKNVAPSDYSIAGNYINLPQNQNYFGRRIERVINNELNHNNLQNQNSFWTSGGHLQTNSDINSKDITENLTPVYNQLAQLYNSNHKNKEKGPSKDIDTNKTVKILSNAQPTRNNSFEHNIYVTENPFSICNDTNSNENNIQLTGNQKNDEAQSSSRDVENLRPFCDSTETRTTENHSENSDLISKEKHKQKNSIINNIKIEKKLDSFCGQQLTDKQLKQERVDQNELNDSIPQTVDSFLLSTEEQSKKNDNRVTENIISFCTNNTTEQNHIEPNNTAIVDNKLMCTTQETEEEYISKDFLNDIEVKENFDPFYGQHLTNQQQTIETRRLNEIFQNELKYSEPNLEDSKLPPENDVNITENMVLFSGQQRKEAVDQNELKNSTQQTVDLLLLSAEDQSKKNDIKITENVIRFCSNSTTEQNHIELINTRDDIEIKETFDAFSNQQLTNKQKYIETRRLEETFENELNCSKIRIKHLVSLSAEDHSQKYSKEDVNNVKENFSPNKQIDSEARKQEAVNQNYLPCFKLERNYVENNNDTIRNVNNQEHSNNQKDLETKSTKAENQYLSSVDSNNDVKGNFSSLHTQQLSNEQKDLETRNTEAENEYLPSFITETEDSVSLAAVEESSVEDEQSNQETVFQNHLSCSKVEIGDSDSLSEEEDTEIYSFTDDFEVKEEFVPHYSSDSKFYRELVNSINSESASNNSKLPSSSPEANTPINNFYNNFHNKSVNNSNIVKCPICANKLDLASMPNHLKTHISNNDFDKCKCSICSEELLKGMLPRHLDLHHKKTGKKVNCPVCDKVMNKKNLRPHLKTHERLTNFKCDICNKKYKQEKWFEGHKKIHILDTEDWQYKCEICKKHFFYKEGLRAHMRHHVMDKKYECTICNSKFYTEFNLTSHQITHTAKIWKCSDCDKLFNHSSNLSQHRRIHIGIKKYECKICNMKFLHDSHLKQHEHTHTGAESKKFKCTVCKKAFIYNSSLKKHMKTHANDNSDTE